MLNIMRFRKVIFPLLIVICVLIAYSNSFQVPYLFDDDTYIRNNPLTRDFSYFDRLSEPEVHQKLDKVSLNFRTRTLTFLSFRANYLIGGFNVTGYHLVNLAIHVVNGFLVYIFITLIFETPFLKNSGLKYHSDTIALLAAILFVSHPLQTEAVTYISQRFASLATTFYLATCVTYLRSRLSKKPPLRVALYFISILLAVAAMKTKEISFTLPMVIVVLEFAFFEADIRKRTALLLPILLTMMIVPLSLLDLDKPLSEAIGDSTKTQETISRQAYILTQPRVIVTYLRLLLFPINQNLDYDYPLVISPLTSEFLLPLMIMIVLFSSSIFLIRRSRNSSPELRLISLGILWFFITLSVESSVIALADVIFEHRLYLPSIGIFLMTAVGVVILFEKLKNKRMRNILISSMVMVSVLLIATTFARNMVWNDSIGFWSDVVNKSPLKLRAHANLAQAYKNEGLFDKALEHYQIIADMNPNIAEVHNNLGNLYLTRGQVDKAIGHFRNAISLKPNLMMAYYNLGVIYLNKGLFDMAIKNFKVAITLNPYYSEAHNNLDVAYSKKGQSLEAIEHFKEALKLMPENVPAYKNLEIEYQQSGIK